MSDDDLLMLYECDGDVDENAHWGRGATRAVKLVPKGGKQTVRTVCRKHYTALLNNLQPRHPVAD